MSADGTAATAKATSEGGGEQGPKRNYSRSPKSLQDLLLNLASDKPLELSVLAACNVSIKKSDCAADLNVLSKLALQTQLDLFEKHIGPYDAVISNANRHSKKIADHQAFNYRFSQRVTPVPIDAVYAHPNIASLAGPCPDLCIWTGLFFGTDMEATMRSKVSTDSTHEIPAFGRIHKILKEEVPKLSVIELMTNILTYLSKEAEKVVDAATLLRFCAIYGLSGAMTDVLNGSYKPTDGLTIDTLLSASSADELENRQAEVYSMFSVPQGELLFPAYAIGVALGHCNVVRHSIHSLGATIGEQSCFKRAGSASKTVFDDSMLWWAITKNDTEMVKCLVQDCGFQFRWLSNNFEDMFKLLFHINCEGNGELGVWRGPAYNPDDNAFDRRGQAIDRSRCSYSEKKKMLRTVIAVGLPRELFIPVINVERDNDMLKEAIAKGLGQPSDKMMRDNYRSLDKLERKARCYLTDALVEFNEVKKKKERLPVHLFYAQYIADLWENQPKAQEARLPVFEKLDPRWKEFETRGEAAFLPWWEYTEDDEADSGSDVGFSDESDATPACYRYGGPANRFPCLEGPDSETEEEEDD